jgi:glycosyltransferase involved in cell wall biosynthesis
MSRAISVIIPNRNGSTTIGKCLESVFSSSYGNYEVIVVDDCSEDDSVKIITGFPCKLVRLGRRSGAAGARNAGAHEASGEILFFTDADCILEPGTLGAVARSAASSGIFQPLSVCVRSLCRDKTVRRPGLCSRSRDGCLR